LQTSEFVHATHWREQPVARAIVSGSVIGTLELVIIARMESSATASTRHLVKKISPKESRDQSIIQIEIAF
jgi:hypothetical protein